MALDIMLQFIFKNHILLAIECHHELAYCEEEGEQE
jgi:hypothetical protein